MYPAGRLDFDSEGLLLLTDDGALQARIASPKFKLEKTYLVQVEGSPSSHALEEVTRGVLLKDGISRAVQAVRLETPPEIEPREPPIPPRYRDSTTWVEVVMNTGRNRQVRRTLAAVGHPVLRLIRTRIGPWSLADLAPGQWLQESVHLPRRATPDQRFRQSDDRR